MLHPQARRAVEARAGEMPVHHPAYDVDAARAEAQAVAAAAPREEVARVSDIDAGGVPARLYRPEGAGDGIVVHFHGGGFVFNDVEVHDAICRAFANRLGLAVLSVDYRRPPEARFPAAVEDVDAVLAWLATSEFADVPTYAHGDSAGGNLALVAALRHPGRFTALALVYPFLDPTMSFPSYQASGTGFDPEEAAWYWRQYAATEADLHDPDLAPLLSPALDTLPPTLVVSAEHDPLRDEAEHLAQRLADLGVQVVATRYLGQVHGFWRHPDVFDAAEPLLRQVAGFLLSHHA
ncbi:alpha/beta hydrolase [Nocardioides sp. AE5]|uniref:alpha/beta hydrolase n=1 Tax=Nocardioides sp. AE5 TaxID=2962573 RepID=UPI002881C643|nr:alpha/beta hydrolase [Nocardioides sp. AE5]MDT0202769.1 alpha/beta hydrolase [Nocardioides sp. AE5]